MENSEFKMETMEFRGYVKRALEEIDDNLENIHRDMKKNNRLINSIQLKVAGISATVAILVTIVTMLLKNVIFNGG